MLDLQAVKPSDDVREFKVLPRRWVFERKFGWLMLQRRLLRDYERTIYNPANFIHIAMIRLQLRRLA